MKGCVISAAMSGSGKTTATLGILAALRRRGTKVQPFKVGPDFIDTGLHAIAAGVDSHNLDGWMISREANKQLFARGMSGKEIAVVEGVMGLFDGFDGRSENGSTAQMAVWLGLPVVLVIDAHAMARSAAAIVHGLRTFDPRLQIAGVIFNRVAGERHYRILADALEGTPIFGSLPSDPSIQIPERHLGLFTAEEELTVARINAIGNFFEKHVSVDALLDTLPSIHENPPEPVPIPPKRRRVALAHDKAFSFYYHANRFELERAGAEIVEFSPLQAREVPEADLLYLGGGYPELYREELANNTAMLESIRQFTRSGKKFYAECGGMMYLAQSIDGFQMAGVVPVDIEMTQKLVQFGYCQIETRYDSILGPAGTTARGHQFHYSRAVGLPGDAYNVLQGGRQYPEGFIFANGIASYVHLHFLSNSAIARNMLE